MRSGLAEGELVVTSGQFLIDSESKLQEAVQKFLRSANAEEGAEGNMAPVQHEDSDGVSPHAGRAMPAVEE